MLEEPRAVYVLVPAVVEAVLVTKLDTYEALDERGVVAQVVSDDPVGLRWIRTLKKDARWSDDNVVTGDVPLREPERLEGRDLGADAREAVDRVIVRLAHLELHGKLTQ